MGKHDEIFVKMESQRLPPRVYPKNEEKVELNPAGRRQLR
jgi:hypothetical protein